MSSVPFVHLIQLPGKPALDALFGFSLPTLPDIMGISWLSGTSAQERRDEMVRTQLQLVRRLWNSNITYDLRFLGTDEGITIALFCRINRPEGMADLPFKQICYQQAQATHQLFAEFGYDIEPFVDEATFIHALIPFRIQSMGEIRSAETVLAIQRDAYTIYEVYVPYPLQWTLHYRLQLLYTLLQRQGNALVSFCLEPTRLAPQEQQYLLRGTSQQMKSLLWMGGPDGREAYTIYTNCVQQLQKPYLVRISVAAATPIVLSVLERVVRDELLGIQSITPVGQAPLYTLQAGQRTSVAPALVIPQTRQEWETAYRNMLQLNLLPWGPNLGMERPETMRLRALMSDLAASTVFRLPIAAPGEIVGVPIGTTSSLHGGNYPVSEAADPFASVVLPTAIKRNGPSAKPHTPNTTSLRKPEDLIGLTLNNYQLLALLGNGGFGAVYRAKQLNLQRDVAIKVVLAGLNTPLSTQQKHSLLRFEREARAVAQLDHPNILSVYEYQTEPFPYFVIPYIAGGSLADKLKANNHRPIPPHNVASMLTQIASALDYVHQQRLVHRDMKPQNLLCHQDGRLLLADFGIVQFEDSELTKLTQPEEHSPYTPQYASPEQRDPRPGLVIDYRSDIFSLGIIVYELLCGNRPFANLIQLLQEPPLPLSQFKVAVPPALETAIGVALAKKPAQRYQSAGAFATAFQKAL